MMPEADSLVRAIAALNETSGRDLTFVESPDESVRDRPAVDAIFGDELGRVAVEHTTFDSFQFQRRVEDQVAPLADAVNTEGLEAADDSRLVVVVRATEAPRITERDHRKIIEWVKREAPRLGEPPDHYSEMDPPLKGVFLYRFPAAKSQSTLVHLGIDSSELQNLLTERTDTALEKKLPKLESAREDEGADETMLVIEASGSELNGVFDIAQTIQDCVARQRISAPDHIVLDHDSVTWIVRRDGLDIPFIRSA